MIRQALVLPSNDEEALEIFRCLRDYADSFLVISMGMPVSVEIDRLLLFSEQFLGVDLSPYLPAVKYYNYKMLDFYNNKD